MARVVALSIVVLAALAPPARADEGMLPSGELEFRDLFIHLDGDPEFTQAIVQDQLEYFNLAHCVCSGAGVGMEQDFQLSMIISGATSQINRPADIWIGADCENDLTRATNCVKIDSQGISDLSLLQDMLVRRTFQVADLIAPVAESCPAVESTGNVYVLADIAGTGTYDYGRSATIDFDTQGPPPPEMPTADGGENAIQVDWTAPVARAEDVAYYQALCARVDNGAPAVSPPSHEARYETSFQLCPTANAHEVILTGVANKRTVSAFGPVDAAVDGPPADAAVDAAPTPDAPIVTNLPQGLIDLDAAFICGETTAPASSLRIGGLENDVEYRVVVLAIDLSGNASGIYFQNSVTPRLVTDFWEDLHDKGSDVEGGFCLVAEAYGNGGGPTSFLRRFRDDTLAGSALGRWLTSVYYDISGVLGPVVHGSIVLRIVAAIVIAPLLVIAFLWHVLTLPGLILVLLAVRHWRRRRRGGKPASRRLLAAATLVGVLAIGSSASAQPSSDPYWADPMFQEDVGEELLDPHWHVGLRAGPYVPAIDDQVAGTGPGPYEQMFGGGARIMPVLDVDWLFWRGFGQLGIGGSVGAMWKSAKAYQSGSDPNDPMRPRSEGDATTFRLIPLAATAVYRFTYLDDRYGIPVVPYVRGGLSYYIWWIGAPSGNTAVIHDPPGCDPDTDGCKENRARGASLGVQGSIGLAIRAERIDSGAARSMRQGGVEHAGFYAELQLAKVDGFGNEKKLSVGDATWFAGVDFEF
jgi:hypothetical protein